jgi:hypothetical protein
MTEKKACPLCGTECTIYSIIMSDHNTIDCLLCGKYNLAGRAKEHLNSRKHSFYIISGVTRNFYELHKDTSDPFVISYEMITDDAKFQAEFISKAPKSVLEKASLLLQYIARNSNEKPSTPVSITVETDYSIIFCKDRDELNFYINYLTKRGLIRSQNTHPELSHLKDIVDTTYDISLTFDGWVEVEKLKRPNLESTQAFVAMWFDDSMNEIFEKGILPLGDKNETGFKMVLIKQKHFNDKICDHILAEIKQSRFVIADCTGLRHAVLFEAGYAMGLGLPVIFTCKEGTDIKKCFDTDHYNHIVWKDADDLKNQLRDRILATIGKAH